MEREARILFRGIAHVVARGLSRAGEVQNLSVGGSFVVLADELPVGGRLTITIPLGDGKPPVAAHAVIAWARRLDDERCGHGLRFVRLDDAAARRIADLVAGHALPREVLLGAVRLRLPGVPMRVRARASERSSGVLTIESELSWLRVGAEVTIEVAPDDVRHGQLSWFAMEVGSEGHARIVFTVDVRERVQPSASEAASASAAASPREPEAPRDLVADEGSAPHAA